MDYTTRFCTEKSIPQNLVHENQQLQAELQKGVDNVNTTFARVEHVRKFAILPRDLSIEEGELTPTLKIKRSNIMKNWQETIDNLYGESIM